MFAAADSAKVHTKVLPRPARRVQAGATVAPTRPPTPPQVMSRPRPAGEKCKVFKT